MPNRNSMSHFAVNPQVDIQRSRFPMNTNIKFTGDAASIIPFYCVEVLPGDTFDVTTSLVCRMQTLIHPIMDDMYLDTYYFLYLIGLFGITGSIFAESRTKHGFLLVNGLCRRLLTLLLIMVLLVKSGTKT